jgi:hypothetical protein
MNRDSKGRFCRQQVTAENIGACILIILFTAIALLA